MQFQCDFDKFPDTWTEHIRFFWLFLIKITNSKIYSSPTLLDFESTVRKEFHVKIMQDNVCNTFKIVPFHFTDLAENYEWVSV